MRLKRLVISGFKSFPKRTVIKFMTGISAIVGPNGCGKSNIADAIRWALGEQSPARLRARQMEDLLYRSDDGRLAPLAEVSLLMDNSSGMAPPELADLPEIEVKRILYRSGETRYLLNGKHCRLKDIHYLFMDTGAGTRAYSIIDQGQIGRYVEMGPDERRHMVEEAAGISRFKARRVDAMRKMRRAGENLHRLDDLLHEIEKQRKSLSRQAEKARRFRELRQRKELLETTLMRRRWELSMSELNLSRRRKSAASADLTALNSNISAMEMRLEMSILEEAEAAAKVKKAEMNYRHINSRLELFQKEHGCAERETILAATRLNEFLKRSSEAERRVEELGKRIEDLDTDSSALKDKLASMKEKVSFAESGVDESASFVRDLRGKVEEMKEKVVAMAAGLAGLRTEKNALQERIARIESRCARGGKKLLEISSRVAELTREKSMMEKKIEENNREMESMQAEANALSSMIETVSLDLQKTKDAVYETEKQHVKVATQIDAMRDMLRKRRGVPEEIRKVLDDRENICGIVSDFVEVDAGYEHAVERLLGEFLHGVMVPDGIQAAIRFALRHRGKGIPVIPLGCNLQTCSIRQKSGGDRQYRLTQPSGKNVPEWFRKHVKIPAFLDVMIESITSKAVLYSTLEEMLSLSDEERMRGETGNAVTLQGDVITSWNGILPCGNDADSGILSVKNRVKASESEAEVLTQEIKRLSEKQKGIEHHLKGLQKKAIDAAKKIERVKKDSDNADRRINKIEPELKMLASRQSVLEYEITEDEQEADRSGKRLAALLSGFERMKEEEQEIISALDGRKKACRQQEKILGARRRKLEQLKREVAVLENSIDERARERKRLHEELRQMQGELALRKDKKKEMETILAESESALALASAKINAQKVSLKDAGAVVHARKKEMERESERIVSLRNRMAALRERMRTAEKKVHELALKISDLENGTSFLENGMWEKYRKNINEIPPVPSLIDMKDDDISKEISELDTAIARTGPVNFAAEDEYRKLGERLEYLQKQKEDLLTSISDLQEAADRLDRQCRSRFSKAMREINESLEQVFPLMFEGGSASLELERPLRKEETAGDDDKTESVKETGIEFFVRLPGKKIRHLGLLSGGEKTMAAIALIFALYFIRPCPFCILDEVDAPLDEANTVRFNRLLEKVSEMSQVILVTHNHLVMEMAYTLYGVTMEKKGVSKLVSVNMEERNGLSR